MERSSSGAPPPQRDPEEISPAIALLELSYAYCKERQRESDNAWDRRWWHGQAAQASWLRMQLLRYRRGQQSIIDNWEGISL